jgi:transposase
MATITGLQCWDGVRMSVRRPRANRTLSRHSHRPLLTEMYGPAARTSISLDRPSMRSQPQSRRARQLRMLGHDARLMPAKYVRPYSKGQKNDFRDAEAIAGQSRCERSGHAGRWKDGSPTCRRVSSTWRLASARIISVAEAVQRPTMKFVATKTAEQLDLQALHRVRERLVSQRTGIGGSRPGRCPVGLPRYRPAARAQRSPPACQRRDRRRPGRC